MSNTKPLSNHITLEEILKIARNTHSKGEVMVVQPLDSKDTNRYFIHVVPFAKPAKSKSKGNN